MTTRMPPSQPDCEWIEECVEICTARTVFVEDRGVRATFRNPSGKQIRKIHYDGCYCKVREARQSDFIVSLLVKIDVIVELKGSDRNLTGESGAYEQVESTLAMWEEDENRSPRIAALIIYGKIESKKKLPGRIPSAFAQKLALEARFLMTHRRLLLIHENGEKQFNFNDFLRSRDAR